MSMGIFVGFVEGRIFRFLDNEVGWLLEFWAFQRGVVVSRRYEARVNVGINALIQRVVLLVPRLCLDTYLGSRDYMQRMFAWCNRSRKGFSEVSG